MELVCIVCEPIISVNVEKKFSATHLYASLDIVNQTLVTVVWDHPVLIFRHSL